MSRRRKSEKGNSMSPKKKRSQKQITITVGDVSSISGKVNIAGSDLSVHETKLPYSIDETTNSRLPGNTTTDAPPPKKKK
jgi:hypothetical protein